MSITKKSSPNISEEIISYPNPLKQVLYSTLNVEYEDVPIKNLIESLNIVSVLAEKSDERKLFLQESLSSLSIEVESQIDDIFNQYVKASLLAKENRVLNVKQKRVTKSSKSKKLTKKQLAEQEKKKYEEHMKLHELAKMRRDAENKEKALIKFELRNSFEIHNFVSMIPPLNTNSLLSLATTASKITSSSLQDTPSLLEEDSIKRLFYTLQKIYNVNPSPLISWNIYEEKLLQVVWRDLFANEQANANEQAKNFLIIGPPCSGKNQLAKLIQDHYNSVYINLDNLLQESYEQQTEIGSALREVFPNVVLPVKPQPPEKPKKRAVSRKSKKKEEAPPVEEVPPVEVVEQQEIPDPSIDEEIKNKLLIEKLNSPEVVHRGYIITWNPYRNNSTLLDFLFHNLPKYVINLSCSEEESSFRLENVIQREENEYKKLEEEIAAISSELEESVNVLKDEYAKLEEKYKKIAQGDAPEEQGEGEEAPSQENEEEEYEVDENGEQILDEEGNPIPKKKKRTIEELNNAKKHLQFKLLIIKERLESRKDRTDFTIDLQQILERVSQLPDALLELDATLQLPSDLSNAVIQNLSFETPTPIPYFVPKSISEDEETEAEEEEILQYLQDKNIYLSSVWKKFCPVAFKNGIQKEDKPTSSNPDEDEESSIPLEPRPPGTAVPGLIKYGVVYRNTLYYLHSEVAARHFKQNPIPFLSESPISKKNVIIFGNCTISSHVSFIQSLKTIFPQYGLRNIDFFIEYGEKIPTPVVEEEEPVEDEDAPKKKAKVQEIVYEYPPIEPTEQLSKILTSGCFIDATNYTQNQIDKIFSDRIFPSHVILLETPEPTASEEEETTESPEEEEGEDADQLKKLKKVEEPSDGIPLHFKKYATYKSHIDAIIAKFEELTIPVSIITGVDNKQSTTILHQSRSEFDPFLPIASIFEGSTKLPLGETKSFCPVTLKEKGLLQLGNEEIVASFQNRLYYFKSEAERDLFIIDPFRYSTNIHLPPPAFWIVGLPVSGKSSVANKLSTKYDIPIIKFEECFMESFSDQKGFDIVKKLFEKMHYVPPKVKPTVTDDEEEEPQEEEVDEEALALKKRKDLFEIFCALLSLEPFKSKGYILDGLSLDDSQAFLRGSITEENEEEGQKEISDYTRPLAPSLVISCTITPKVFLSRKLPSLLKDTEEKRIKKILDEENKKIEKIEALKLKKQKAEEEEEEAAEEEEEEALPSKSDIEDKLNEEHSEADSQLTSLVEFLNENRIPVLSLNGGKAKRSNFNRVENSVKQYINGLESILLNSKIISHDEALSYLRSGIAFLNNTYGYDDAVIVERRRNLYFTKEINPFLRRNRILVRFTLFDNTKILSSFEFSNTLSDFQSYVDKYFEAINYQIKQYNLKIGEEIFEQDGSGFWYNFVANETIKANSRRVRSLKKKNKILSLFDRGYTKIASSNIPLEVTLLEWIERIEEPKPKKIRSEEDGEEEEEEDIVEEEDEEEAEPEPEYELDEAGEPLLDEDGNPILKKKPQPPQLSYPVLVQGSIYFFSTDENRSIFLTSPQTFENIHGPSRIQFLPQCFNSHISVLGNDEAIVERYSRSIASQLGAIYISIVDIYQTCLQLAQYSKFAKQISQQKIELLDESTIIRLILHTLNAWDVKVRGYVLGGLPNTLSLANSFTEHNIEFHSILFISPTGEYEKLQNYFNDEFHNTLVIDSDNSSMWKIIGSVEDSVTNRITRSRIHNELVSQGLPAPILDIGLKTSEFVQKLSKFKNYCPVSFVDHEILMSVNDPLRTYGVEYQGLIYLISTKEKFNKFLNQYSNYSSELYELPNDLPEKVILVSSKNDDEEDEEEIKSTFALQGFDPILLKTIQEDGEPIVVRGSSQFVVRYQGKLFRTATVGNLERFMSQPWLYADAILPSKIPIRKIEYSNLNILQYLEESLQRIISKALIELNRERPLHPKKNTKESALEFIALYLRRMNPENNIDIQKRTDEAFNSFIRACNISRRLTLQEQVSDEDKNFLTTILHQ